MHILQTGPRDYHLRNYLLGVIKSTFLTNDRRQYKLGRIKSTSQPPSCAQHQPPKTPNLTTNLAKYVGWSHQKTTQKRGFFHPSFPPAKSWITQHTTYVIQSSLQNKHRSCQIRSPLASITHGTPTVLSLLLSESPSVSISCAIR